MINTGNATLDFAIGFCLGIGCLMVVGFWGSAFIVGGVNEMRRRQGREEMPADRERHIGVSFGYIAALLAFFLGLRPFG